MVDRVAAGRAPAGVQHDLQPGPAELAAIWDSILKEQGRAADMLQKLSYNAYPQFFSEVELHGEKWPAWTSWRLRDIGISLLIQDRDDRPYACKLAVHYKGQVTEITQSSDFPEDIRRSTATLCAILGFLKQLAKEPGKPVWDETR